MATVIRNNRPQQTPTPEPTPDKSKKTTIIVLSILSVVCILACVFMRSGLGVFVGVFVFFVAFFYAITALPPSRNKPLSEKEIAGKEGEDMTAALLSCLPEDYTILRNSTLTYQNESSEIDNIIIGKTGVFIVETKNLKGTVHADYRDKDWKKVKIDQYGISHEDSFYSPLKQVGTHTFRLANYLRSNGVRIHIESMVFFSNADATVHLFGEPGDISIFMFYQSKQMLRFIAERPPVLSPTQMQNILNLLIVTEHEGGTNENS